MIEYRFPHEKDILLHYAKILGNTNSEKIISAGFVRNAEEAEILAGFYWAMVDRAVEDSGAGLSILENEGIEIWLEYIFHSLNGYMVSSGYTSQWDKE